jgi:hypothetical protein
MADDTTFADLGAWLLECARAALALTSAGVPGRRYRSVGRPAHDNCCAGQGQLTVARVRTYPSAVFPVPDNDPVPCGGKYTVVQFEVEVIRCAPVPANDGTAPSAELLDASAREIDIDGRAVYDALRCCIQDRIKNWQALDEQAGFEGYVDSQAPVGPEGGCAGTRTVVVLGIPDGCACA